MAKAEYTDDSKLTPEQIIDKYYEIIRANALYLTNRSKSDAEDLTQNVFMLMVEKWDTISHDRIGAWLLEVERRKALEYFRTQDKQKGGKDVVYAVDPAYETAPVLAVTDAYFDATPELIEELKREILDSLDEDERRLYEDVFVNGRSYDDIAALYSTTGHALRTRVWRLRKKISKMIGKKGGDLGLNGIAYLSFAAYLASVMFHDRV